MGGADEEDAGAGGRPDEEDDEPAYTGPTVVELRLDRQHSCARLEDATVHCWGKDVTVYPDPSGGFTEMGVVTWPDGPYASTGPEPPQIDFTQVSYGKGFGCGLRSDETLECWGANDFGQATPPAGAYELVAAGAAHACAFGNARGVVCWGKNDAFQASPPSAISAKNHGYVRVVTGGSGVRYGGIWMETEEEGGGSGWDPFHGSASACGLRADGRLDCFGAATAVPTPRKKFRDVSAADQWVCGATAEGVECWGSGIERATVSGDFVQVSTAHDVTCALDAKKRIHCWAPLPGGTKTDVPSGTFERVVAAGTNDEGSPRAVFALRADGSLVIFRPDDSGAIAGQTELPGPFVDLAVGPEEGCVLDDAGALACWNAWGLAQAASEGTFARVLVGFRQYCDLRPDGRASCWGFGSDELDFVHLDGEYPGPFVDLAMGNDYACGVLADGGGIKCWGSHVR
jgi:hypothetical protein